MKKAMAPHSSVLAWRIPGMEEPGGLPSMGLHRVRHERGKMGVMQGGKWKREVSCVDAEREETRKKPPLSF